MTPDWTRLVPHRPLAPGADFYEPGPAGTSEAVAKWVLAGGSAVLVGGPAGVGKSTELSQVAHQLRHDRVACLVPVDRWENMRRVTPDQLLLRIAGRLVYLAVVHLHLEVSRDVRAMLWRAGVLPFEHVGGAVVGEYEARPAELLELALNEVARLARQGRVALILDGLEKLPEGPSALDVFDALAAVPDYVDVITVVPWQFISVSSASLPLWFTRNNCYDFGITAAGI